MALSINEKIQQYTAEISEFNPANADELEQFRIKYLSKKGLIPALFGALREAAPEEKRTLGKPINEVKTLAEGKYQILKDTIEASNTGEAFDGDMTLPGYPVKVGGRHPLSLVRNRLVEIFERIGFTVSEGPEIEDDWHNFSALNFPEEHPARDMQDTFFVDHPSGDYALRTHTSSVQVRVMENSKPPIRTISPGRVFRNEAISARAHCIFHQVEGLYIDENVSFADLKQTLFYFAKEMFGDDTQVRFRPSFFPFTEPSAEMDIECKICKGKGCNVCKYSGWVEILGCGMVDPNVLESCNIDAEKYTGFAFGMGIERITMLKYQVKDLRLFFENDIRFLSQFKTQV